MTRDPSILLPAPALSRRRFVQGLAAGGVLLGLSAQALRAAAQEARTSVGTAPILRGTEFDLVLAETPVNFTGQPGVATTINGSLPGPTLRWREGDTVTVRVTNRLAEPSAIHWHGVTVPYQMDGVPGLSFKGIAPGATFTYRFKVRQSGTYWYHSHAGVQELTGMYGAIIVDPADGAGIRADRDHVLLLSDWTDTHPLAVYTKLKSQSDYYNRRQPTAADFLRDAARDGLAGALDQRRMWNRMRMSPTDLADVSAPALTYLVNGVTPAGNWTGLFRPGERVRLRFVNGAAHTFYDVRIPGLKLKVVQVDGGDVDPVTVDEFRIAPGETCDVLVEPRDDAYTVFAQSLDRAGYARATLAVRPGLEAPVPAPDPAEWLTMADMMGPMNHGTLGDMAGMGHGAMMDHGSMSGMNHGGMMDHGATAGMDHGSMMGQGTMPGMNHGSAMDHGAMPGMDHGSMTSHDAMPGMAMDHGQHAMGAAGPLAKPSTTVRHARTEYGPGTDMRVDFPRTDLSDPGIGLRNNGRRVLTLADLHTTAGPMDARGPERELELHLTGNMERYAWSVDGLDFGLSQPVRLRHGERVRLIVHNDTMMIHPMHLHGLWSELESPDGRFLARKHTLPVQPAQRISFLVSADSPGRWAWHCHLLFHMVAGMYREVVVA